MSGVDLLKKKIINSSNPVGSKSVNDWKLPPIDFVYGKKEKEDPEGVSKSTFRI